MLKVLIVNLSFQSQEVVCELIKLKKTDFVYLKFDYPAVYF